MDADQITSPREQWVTFARGKLAGEGVPFTNDGRVDMGEVNGMPIPGGIERKTRVRKNVEPEPCWNHTKVQYSCRDCVPQGRSSNGTSSGSRRADDDIALHPPARTRLELAARERAFETAPPYDAICHLDLADVASAEGHDEAASQILTDEIFNRTDDHLPPIDSPEQTSEVAGRPRRVQLLGRSDEQPSQQSMGLRISLERVSTKLFATVRPRFERRRERRRTI